MVLSDAPLMRNVLADMAVESEAATMLAMRVAAAVDRSADAGGPQANTDAAAETGTEGEFLRLAVALGKYWVCKRGPTLVGEALECLGGNGYVEESGLPRLYREAPLNSIWEGSGNVSTLDVLRALARTPGCADALLAELDLAAGGDRRLDAALGQLRELLAGLESATSLEAQYRARRLAGLIAVALQAALLVRYLPGPLADAFCGSRLGPAPAGGPFGTLPDGLDVAAIIDRARVSAQG